MNKPISVLLDPEQSEILDDYPECLIVAHRRASTEQADINRRWILTLVPCSTSAANAAIRIATGQSSERKPKPAKP